MGYSNMIPIYGLLWAIPMHCCFSVTKSQQEFSMVLNQIAFDTGIVVDTMYGHIMYVTLHV